jgi:hypothetical protein
VGRREEDGSGVITMMFYAVWDWNKRCQVDGDLLTAVLKG